ncbi:MBL fold metallo-hydrolase [Saccharothrix deserti]|uniref:MBL fold metallo-hydrolase n=1 Tax=Saccharothrix deserti TaxID=2593674 RepID=UPI00131A61F1|nr:MBL fold metallo-hydrolase [Saccharothrix deserti]
MIERVVTSGTFSLDGGTWDVDNNVWLVGDEHEVVVIDAAHDALAIVRAIGDRSVSAIVCTHAHDDHIGAARELAKATGAPVLLHPDDEVLWRRVHSSWSFEPLSDGQVLSVGGVDLHVLHTPGHSPGAVCLYAPSLGAVFTGDTLFQGGPGATGRSFSDHPTIIKSISERLLTLPPETEVHTGHGDSTTIGAEAGNIA